jgi:hypothetical protein
MTLAVAKLDTQYEDTAVEICRYLTDGWDVRFEDGWSLFVKNSLGETHTPGPGDVLRKFGRGIGYTVRGVGLVKDGELVGLYHYQTAAEEEAARALFRADEAARKRREWEEGKDAFAARVKALPDAFRQRIEFFMRRQDWGPEFGGYELFSCEEAVKIAAHVGHEDKIHAFHDDQADQKRCGISDDHSGNTFGTACTLAAAFLRDPALVPKMHGALCPLVGCQDYGCYSTVKETG